MSFIERAIANIYGVKIINEHGFASLRGLTLADFERNLCARFQKTLLAVSTTIEKANQQSASDPAKRGFLRWNAHAEFDANDPFSTHCRVIFRPPQNNHATSLFLHHYGSDRFLFVSVSGLVNPFLENDPSSRYWNQHWGPIELFKQGITFAGRVYHYFGGEAQSKKNLSLLEKENSPDRCLLLWFFNEDNGIDDVISINEARNRFGQVSTLLPGKCNARLKLGFSHVYPLKIDERCIRMQDDIPADTPATSLAHPTAQTASAPAPATKKIMTDGCGMISIDLARFLPYAISHGVLHANYPHSREINNFNTIPAPGIIQVRCASIRGLFKGCLLVIDDPTICPPNTVIFRPSMLKSTSGPTYPPYPGRMAMLGVVNTFEHPQWMNARHTDISGFTSRLSRPLCLLLHHLGVPSEYFISLMNMEIEKILFSLQDRKTALRLIKEQLNDSLQMIGNNHGSSTTTGKDDSDSDDGGDEGEDDTTTVCTDTNAILHSFLQTELDDNHSEGDEEDEEIVEDEGDFFPPPSSLSRQAKQDPFLTRYVHLLEMILSSQHLAEPYLQEQLRKLAFNKVKRLNKCSLKIKNAISLVGAPDPYNVLQENEVFISFPSDRCCNTNSNSNSYHNYNQVFSSVLACEGRVLVTRNPMQHPGDIRIMTAVNHPLLHSLQSSTNGGVIFFSTKGHRSAGDMMSGGDYDGDLYLVLYGRDELVMSVRDDVPPFEEPDKHPAASSSNGTSNEESVRVCSEHVELIQHHDSATNITRSQSRSNNQAAAVCRVCIDSKGVLMYRNLLKIAQQQHVGRYSNAWLAWADRDPLGANALACGEIVRIALDAQKSGEAVPHRPDLLKKSMYPDFMQPAETAVHARQGGSFGSPGRYNKTNDSSKDNSPSRKKAARPLEQELPQAKSSNDEHVAKKRNQHKVVLPSDMDLAATSGKRAADMMNESQMSDITYDLDNFCWLADQQEQLAADEAMALNEAYAAPPSPSGEQQEQEQERSFPSSPDQPPPPQQQHRRQTEESILSQLHRLLHEKTHSLHQDNNNTQLLIDTDMLIVAGDERLNHHTAFRTKKKKETQLITIAEFERKHGGLTQLFPLPHHHDVLDDVMMCVRDYNRDWSQILNSSNKVLMNREVMTQKMKEKHYAVFDERARRWSAQYHLPLQTARERVAGIFYIATYTAAQQSVQQRGSMGGLSFCWEVCGTELNVNKRRVSLVRQQQSIFAVMALQELLLL